MLDVVFGQATNRGKARNQNEDAMGYFIPLSRQQVRSHGFLFAVADGAGRMERGEIAATTAISVLTREFEKAESGAMLISLLPHLLQCANAAVHNRALAPEFRGWKMSAAVVACALRHDQAVISRVGDSRCYLVREGIARQITQDPVRINELKNTGIASEGNGTYPDMRPMTIHSLGPEMFVSPETTALTIRPGDVLVLCSDGLHGQMPGSEMAAIAAQPRPVADIACELVARATEIDGGDNATAQVVRVRSIEQTGIFRRHPQ